MQRWVQAGLLDIRVPVCGEEEKLDTIIKDYRKWADLHQGGMAFFKTQRDKIPFFDDEMSVWQIRSNIRGNPKYETQSPILVPDVFCRGKNVENKSEMPDQLFNVRIFLSMAQDFDMQQSELTDDLASFEKMEQNLMKSLKGEDSEIPVSSFRFQREDVGHHMTAGRISAWGHLMRHDPEGSALFVTRSRAVFEELADKVPETEKVFHSEAMPARNDENTASWQEGLMEHLNRLAENTWAGSATPHLPETPVNNESERKVSLTIHLVPEETPEALFSRWMTYESPRNADGRMKYKNTLLGLIEF